MGKRLAKNALAESSGDPIVAYMSAVEKKREKEGQKKIKTKKKVKLVKRDAHASAQLINTEDINPVEEPERES